MATFLDDRDRARLMTRLAALTSGSQPRWGKFTVAGMLCHLRESARMASGELHVPDAGKKAFQRFPVKHLILHVFPFPKGAPTAPLLLVTSPEGFEEALHQLNKEWGALVYKHTDHHLRQFGV